MSNLSLALLGHLADASVRVLGLALVAVLVLAILRMRHAPARHAVWSAVLAGMLALPALSPLLPALAVKMSERPASASATIFRNLQTSSRPASPVAPSRRPPAPMAPTWPMVLAGIYLAGLAASLARVLRAGRTCRRLVRESELIHDSGAQELLAELAAAHGMEWPLPQLRSCRSVIVPMVAGFGEPIILLPAGWQSWDGWKLHAVLAHELAHIRRGDWLVTLAASVNRCLFWFHPLAWWMERHLSALAEQASDDAALGCVSDAPRYASTVLDFAATLQSGRRLTHGVAMARTAKVSRRIDRILSLREPGPAIITGRTWAAIALCAVPLVYSAAALQLAAPPSENVQPHFNQLWTAAKDLTSADAQQLEAHLVRNPDDLDARGKLIAYYFAVSPEQRQPRMGHVFWLIEHHPESDLAVSMAFKLSPADEEHAKNLWLQQVASHPNNSAVLANAADGLGRDDAQRYKDLLERAHQAEPSNPQWLARLADLMSRAIVLSLQVQGGTYFSNAPNDQTTVKLDEGLGTAAIAELESSADAVLVGTVGEFISGGPPGGKPAPAPQLDLAEHLLTRAQSLDPANQEWPAALERLHAARQDTAQPEVPKGTVRIRVGGQVQQSNLIQRPVPAYPLQAKQEHVQGLVRFNVIIGKDGHIKSLALISGHPLLVAAAQDAVKQRVYRPTLLNGDPVEVTTIIDVQFTLAD